MPRSRNDAYKRACAQTVGHLNVAITKVNMVYEAFAEQHPEETPELKTILGGLVACKMHLLKKMDDWWKLDEERIEVYL